MTFYPLDFKGFKVWQPEGQPFGFFGWQGIIPAKAGKMAEIMVELMTTKLLDVREVFSRMDPKRMARILSEDARGSLYKVVDGLGQEQLPNVWSLVPRSALDECVVFLSEDIDRYVEGLMEELKENIEDVMDLKHLVVSIALNEKELVVDMFQQVGEQEFEFIRLSGFFFGFAFGVIQSGLFYFYDAWWLLPVCGFLVGYVTNWLALKVIFAPINPIQIGPMKAQGLFLKRQDEVSGMFAELSADYFLKPAGMWGEILQGARFEAFRSMVENYTYNYMCSYLGNAKLPVMIYLGQEGLSRLSTKMASIILEDLPLIIPASYEYTEEAMQIQPTICEKLKALPPIDFEGVLHPVFEEDEIKLIVVGGLLGCAAGMLQVLTVL
ncbi:hypothetical protein A3770_06p44400 [Chloropicon primus]|uniref:DUF445 domain-containing protein n=1 Tax=Chloropicon primus TaxID=1764295 RepID=A0A5B8MRM7_9CHLO|nr:hypothetical protein A3770_06p44400 [Chloropicon primus]|eukprot:QDZ21922.1 hypothetical protein A3770_06p44400 [Chloropicon primus]